MATVTLEQALQLARAQHQAGRLAEAEALYRQILAVQPEHAEVLNRLGAIGLSTGHVAPAAELLGKAVALAPMQAAYHSDLGVAQWLLGHGEEAVACFRRALALRADSPSVHYNLGDALTHLGQLDEASASFQNALRFQPNYPEAYNGLGNVFAKQGRLDDAATAYQRALTLKADFFEAQCNLGDTLTKLGRLDEALTHCQRAVALRPDFPGAHLNLGVVFFREGMFEKALRCYRQSIACQADFADGHLNLALVLLLLGHFEEGWREYEWRGCSTAPTSPPRVFSVPQWDGTPVPGGTILVHADQGSGDTIQFLRFLPLVRERSGAARVILECQPRLQRLLAQASGAGVEIAALETIACACDRHLPLLSLPFALGLREPLSLAQPYLRADSELRAMWRERLGPVAGLRVGLAWAGNPTHRDDRLRSLKPEEVQPLLRVSGVSFYSLQVEPRLSPPAGVIDFSAHLTDFAETAAFMAELDLVISVDTAAAHLAGALGRPVWTLLPFVPDWRWGLEREGTPWYPTMRLFRQRTAGDWAEVVQRVAVELVRACAG